MPLWGSWFARDAATQTDDMSRQKSCNELNDGSEHARYRLACAGALFGLYEIIDSSGRIFTQHALEVSPCGGSSFERFMLFCSRVAAVTLGS